MGAASFFTLALGKDAYDAFTAAHNEATYWHGHGGYTGTIAEKPGYKLFGEISSRHVNALEGYFHRYEQWTYDERKNRPKNPPGIPTSVLPLIREAFATWDDKWGAAVAFQVTGDLVSAYKKQVGQKGSKKKLFVFCGMASE